MIRPPDRGGRHKPQLARTVAASELEQMNGGGRGGSTEGRIPESKPELGAQFLEFANHTVRHIGNTCANGKREMEQVARS